MEVGDGRGIASCLFAKAQKLITKSEARGRREIRGNDKQCSHHVGIMFGAWKVLELTVG